MKRKALGLIIAVVSVIAYLLTRETANAFFLWVGLLLVLFPGGDERERI